METLKKLKKLFQSQIWMHRSWSGIPAAGNGGVLQSVEDLRAERRHLVADFNILVNWGRNQN
jgi:hypothetical protein